MKRLSLPSLLLIAALPGCKGESPVGDVTGNAGTATGNTAGASDGGATSTGNGTTGGEGGDEAVPSTNGGTTSRAGSTSTPTGGTAPTGGAGTAPTGGTTNGAAGAPPLPFPIASELDGGVEGLPDDELYPLYVDSFDLAIALACRCSGGTTAECAARIGTRSQLEVECEDEVFSSDENGREFIECNLTAEQEYILCVVPDDGSDVCSPACEDAYVEDLMTCPELTDDTWSRLDEQCYGVAPFTCDEGETSIPNFRVCDFESDCDDGADESIATCTN